MRVGSPSASPVPLTPPHANAKAACTSWKPLPSESAHGFSQIDTRVRTVSSSVHAAYARSHFQIDVHTVVREDDDDVLMALDAIAEMGARNVIVTLENGCFALLRFGKKTRRVRAFAPYMEPVSGVGSGDVLLAQFLAAVVDEWQPDETVRIAVAAGAASVREVGAGRFDPQVAGAIAANVELAELQPAPS